MYEGHFRLNRRPFGESVPEGGLVSLPSRDAAARRIRYGLEQSEGIALLLGPPGSGKTLLATRVAAEMDAPCVHISYPALPGHELIAYLAEELQAPGTALNPAAAVRRVRSALANTAAKGRRTLIVVDESQLIDRPETYESLRLLTNFGSRGRSDAMLLLVGCPETLLRLPPGLNDRIAARAMLGPLTETECSSYLNGRPRLAGAEIDLFDEEAVRAFHVASDGLPRRLNRLADFALLVAYAKGLEKPDGTAVAAAVRETEPNLLAA